MKINNTQNAAISIENWNIQKFFPFAVCPPYRNRFSILLRHDLLRLNAIVRPRNEKLNIDELNVFVSLPFCLCIQNNKKLLVSTVADICVLSTFSSLSLLFLLRLVFF